MKPETQKQLAASVKAFKLAEVWLEQQKKLEGASAILATKKEKAEREHRDFLLAMGDIEAKRLLGEVTESEADNLDASLTQVCNQRDRLAAAGESLESQRKALEKQIVAQAEAANRALGDLASAFEKELNEELKEATDRLTAIVNRCYAVYRGTGFNSCYNRDLFELHVPSLTSGENLFREPTRRSLRDGEPDSLWQDDPAAMKLYEQLRSLGHTNKTLQRMEKNFLDAGGVTV